MRPKGEAVGGWRLADSDSAAASRTSGYSELAEDDAKRAQKAAEATAVRLLARREHSVEELRRKLIAKGHAEPAVDAVVERLQAKRLVSDDRFVTSFVHHHAQRGQGPIRIRAELRQRGIAAESVDSALDLVEVDWITQAQAVRRRKFGAAAPRNLPERAKQARFLQYRGFSSDQIRAALNSVDPDASFADAESESSLDPDV